MNDASMNGAFAAGGGSGRNPERRIPPGALRAARRILVLKLDELGDFVLVAPLLRALRASAPQAQIMLATSEAALPLTERCPYVDAAVTPVGDVQGGKFSFRGRTPADLHAFAAAFRAGFDVTVNARFDFDKRGAATLAAASRAPVRLAFAEDVAPWKAESNRGFDAAYTHTLPAVPAVAHEVERHLALAAALGATIPPNPKVELYLTDAEIGAAAAATAAGFPGGRPRRLLAVAPTSNVARKDYPTDAFAVLLQRLAAAGVVDGAVLTGAPADVPRAAALTAALAALPPVAGDAAGFPVLDLTGRTDVRRAAATIAGCDFALAVDTGPAHMAAALGVPVAVLFCHPVDGDPAWPYAPQRFRPWTDAALVLQPATATAPCVDKCLSGEAHCIAGLDPVDAAARIAAFFAGSPHRGGQK